METIAKNTSLFELQEIARTITRKEIMANLEALLLLKVPNGREITDGLVEQRIRDLVSEILDRLSEPKLVCCSDILIKALRSEYSLVREESQRLLNKIYPAYLSPLFDSILELENDDNWTVKRFAQDLVLKIARTWEIKEKKLHYNLILKWQEAKDEKTKKVGNLLALQIMESWSVEVLNLYMPFLVECTNLDKNDFETSDLAATLAFKYLSVAPQSERLKNLKYLTSFSNCGNKELRRGFRTMALQTLDSVSPSTLDEYALFLFKCLEGKNKEDRDSAWEKLLKVSPDKLPVAELVYCQVCGLHRVRNAGKELVKKVSDDVLLENLEELLRMQDSDCYGVRYLAIKLATKIPAKKLAIKKDILVRCSESRVFGVCDLANSLLIGI